MLTRLLIAALAALLAWAPVSAQEHSRKKSQSSTANKKAETGASCKAPAVGVCASCAITCRPAETATCAPGQVSADMCITQPACKCSTR